MLGSVCGYVVRADDGAPVVNAAVDVVRGPGAARPGRVVTGSAGSFALSGLPEGEWVLSATSPAGRGQATVHVFESAASDVTIEVPGSAGGGGWTPAEPERDMRGRVRGRVVRAVSGEPIADAAITVVRGAGPAPDIAPLTDGAGAFALDELPAGEWVLRAYAPGGEAGEATASVAPGFVTNVTIEVPAAGLGGTSEGG